MTDLKTILSEIKKTRLKKDVDLTKVSQETITAQKGRKRSAELRLPYLERDYKLALAKHVSVFLVTGSESYAFGELAEEITKAPVLDAEVLYKELLNRMPVVASAGKLAPKAIVDLLQRHLLDIASDLEISSLPMPQYKHSRGFAVNNPQDLYRFIKRVISETAGSEVSAAYILKQAAEQALQSEFDEGSYPVIVRLEDSSLTDTTVEGFKEVLGSVNLLTAGEIKGKINTRTFSSVEEVTKESVLDTLKEVKKSITKSGRRSSASKTQKESKR